MIAVSLAASRKFTAALRSGADYLELRNDSVPNAALERLIQRSTLPVILTLKRPIARKTLHQFLQQRNIHFVDVDYRQSRLLRLVQQYRRRTARLIVSAHDYHRTPSWPTMKRLVRVLERQSTDVIKIATMIRSVDDLVVIKRLQEQFGKRIIAIGMGELGMMTRLYNRGLLTYAAVNAGRGTAPGQLTVKTMRSMQLYGLIGAHIEHSLSPSLHNAAFRQNHLPYRYQLWPTSHLAEFMEVFQFFSLPGASVTAPFKRDVMRYCDKLDPHARAIGGVNTLVRRGHDLWGYNTDWIGVTKALVGQLRNQHVLILGTGGAASACAYAARRAGAHTIGMVRHADLPTKRTDFDVLINATPVGNCLLVSRHALHQRVVMDCIYGRKTTLLRAAVHAHARLAIDGLAMLRYQAAAQNVVWTGKKIGKRSVVFSS